MSKADELCILKAKLGDVIDRQTRLAKLLTEQACRISQLEEKAADVCVIKGENQPEEARTILIGSPWTFKVV